MAKTLAEMEKGLAVRYAGKTFEKNGFTYIPWANAATVANEVFGIDGYAVDVLKVQQDGEGYMAQVRVTVFPTDSKPFYREGIGYNELSGQGGRAYDTAIKGAASDALNRALKLFGDAFGLYLSMKEGQVTQTGVSQPISGNTRPNTQAGTAKPSDGIASSPSARSGSANDKRPSEKQNAVLVKAGFPQHQIDAMAFPTWKQVIDAIFQKQPLPVQPETKKPVVEELNLTDDKAEDAIPF